MRLEFLVKNKQQYKTCKSYRPEKQYPQAKNEEQQLYITWHAHDIAIIFDIRHKLDIKAGRYN